MYVRYIYTYIHTYIHTFLYKHTIAYKAFCKGLDSFMGTAASKPAEQKVQIIRNSLSGT